MSKSKLGTIPGKAATEKGSRRRFGIKHRLFVAFGAVAATTVAAGVAGWISYMHVEDTVATVVEDRVPTVTRALTLSADSNALASIAPAISAARSKRDRAEVTERLDKRTQAMSRRIDALAARTNNPEAIETIREAFAQTRNSLKTLRAAVSEQAERQAAVDTVLSAKTKAHEDLLKQVETRIDAAEETLRNSNRAANAETAEALNTLLAREVRKLRRLLSLKADVTRILGLLKEAAGVEVPAKLDGVQYKLDKPLKSFRENAQAIPEGQRAEQARMMVDMFETYVDKGKGVLGMRRKVLAGDAMQFKLDQMVRGAAGFYSRGLKSLDKLIGRTSEDLVAQVERIATDNGERLSRLLTSEVGALRALLQVKATANSMSGLAEMAAQLDSVQAVNDAQDAYTARADSLRDQFAQATADTSAPKLVKAIDAFVAQGKGDDSVFARRRALLESQAKVAPALDRTRESSRRLSKGVDRIVTAARADVAGGQTQITGAFDRGRTTLLAMAGGSILLAVVIGWLYVGRGIGRRLDGLTTATRRVADGDYSQEIASRGNDEIAEMADTLIVFRDNLAEAERVKAREEHERERMAEERRRELNGLADSFEASVRAAVDKVTESAANMKGEAENLVETARNTKDQSASATRATENANTNVQQVAGASEQMSKSINEETELVQRSTQIAAKATERAAQTNETVKSLEQASQKIGEVINLIQDIAAQTNLLALNATIEAARAGEAGKGFAVVANEVKSLATQTGNATEDISGQINEIQRITNDTVQAIADISATIDEINEITGTIASSVEEQGSATEEIARSAQSAADSARQVNENMAEVDRAAAQTGQAAQGMLDASQTVGDLSQNLRQEVDDFVGKVRAG